MVLGVDIQISHLINLWYVYLDTKAKHLRRLSRIVKTTFNEFVYT